MNVNEIGRQSACYIRHKVYCVHWDISTFYSRYEPLWQLQRGLQLGICYNIYVLRIAMHISSVGDHCSHLDDWLPHLPLMFSFIIPRNFSRQLDKTSLLFWNQDTQCWDIKCNTGQVKLYSLSLYTLWHCESFPLLTLDLLITNPFKRALTLTPNLQYRPLRPHEEKTQFQWGIIWF